MKINVLNFFSRGSMSLQQMKMVNEGRQPLYILVVGVIIIKVLQNVLLSFVSMYHLKIFILRPVPGYYSHHFLQIFLILHMHVSKEHMKSRSRILSSIVLFNNNFFTRRYWQKENHFLYKNCFWPFLNTLLIFST